MQTVSGPRPAPVMSQNWDLFRFFLAAARAGSIARAAGQLAESPATVGRKLRELETALSATLFDRSISGVELTSCGSRILASAEQMEHQARLISEAVSGNDGQLAGTVTVAAPSGLGQTLLAPQLRELHNLHPELRVKLLLSTGKVNLLNREADIAVRIGTPSQERLVGHKLGAVGFGIYASSLYLDEIGEFETAADLAGHNVIAASGDMAQTVQCQEFAGISERCNVALTTDSIFAQMEAVKSGLGIAPFPKYLGRSHPDLVELLPGQLQATADLWLLMHPDTSGMARIQTVQEFVTRICKTALAGN
ncbi:LysR family transcriptional regulator [Leisingera aquimarina]|uniref:LysR family transcriptional regulator n=1 Tax=Leisingera aquimarina TaxID=476529 RepID=UPI0004167AAC|nr:LysR family transcriptional regulator [Leisingera aquimarina]